MVRIALVLAVAAMAAQAAARGRNGAAMASFSGNAALKHAIAVTEIGPRPPGSPEHEKTVQYIVDTLQRLGLKPEIDAFTASTPVGQRPMKNIIVRFPGKTDRAVMVGGHYDTKLERRFRFVGANDAGSSTGLLLELARVLKNSPQPQVGVWLVFFDGEEPLGGPWTASDSLHGSRHLAEKMRATGEHRRLAAFILVDMIGEKDLQLLRDLNSTGWLIELARDVAARLKLSHVFGSDTTAVEDDHIPFARIGVAVVDLIDLTYGPDNSYWHTAQDTPDKLSAKSIEAVGRIVLGMIPEIAKRR